MTQIVNPNSANSNNRYGANLALACMSATVVAGSYFATDTPGFDHDLWQKVMIIAGLATGAFTSAAMTARKQEPRSSASTSLLRRAKDAASIYRAAIVEAGRTDTEIADKRQARDHVSNSGARNEKAGGGSKPVDNHNEAATPHFEAERAQLLTSGLTADEVSQILVARASGTASTRSSFGSGVASGVLNNIEVIASHLRGLVPTLKSDLAHMLDPEADGASRISGAVNLGVKTAAAVVLGYFVYLEAVQFRANAYKAWAEACIQRQQNAMNFSTMDELLSGKLRALDAECKLK